MIHQGQFWVELMQIFPLKKTPVPNDDPPTLINIRWQLT
jgi:hypothetical protein